MACCSACGDELCCAATALCSASVFYPLCCLHSLLCLHPSVCYDRLFRLRSVLCASFVQPLFFGLLGLYFLHSSSLSGFSPFYLNSASISPLHFLCLPPFCLHFASVLPLCYCCATLCFTLFSTLCGLWNGAMCGVGRRGLLFGAGVFDPLFEQSSAVFVVFE